MFYINDEPLKKETFPSEWEFLQSGLLAIKNKKHLAPGASRYVFVDPSPRRLASDGKVEPKKYQSFPLKSEKDGARWNWCDSSSLDKSGVRVYSPKSFMFNKSISLDPEKVRDRELIFFFMFISGVASQIIKLENIEEESKALNEKEMQEINIAWYIKSPDSPLAPEHAENGGNEDLLRDFAAAWGVKQYDTLPLATLRRKLHENVLESHKNYTVTKRGYKEFEEEVKVKNRSNVIRLTRLQFAFDNDIVYLDGRAVRYRATENVITYIPDHRIASYTSYLAEYLGRNLSLDEELSETIKAFKRDKEEQNLTVEKLNNENNRGKLLKFAKLLGVEINTKWSNDELREASINALTEKEEV